MPRRPRVFVDGAIYHVYTRFGRGARVFANADEAQHFLAILEEGIVAGSVSTRALGFAATTVWLVLLLGLAGTEVFGAPPVLVASLSARAVDCDALAAASEVIVAYTAAAALRPCVDEDSQLAEAVAGLWLIFDDAGWKASTKALLSLASYQLGEHNHEVWSCLLVRKGRRALPLVVDAAKSPDNECRQRFGVAAPFCLPDATIQTELQIVRELISSGKICQLEVTCSPRTGPGETRAWPVDLAKGAGDATESIQ